MQFLTEDRIKKAGLRFLKSYYRQRERSGGGANLARYDVVTEGGIVVDVHLSFKTPTGQDFQSSMEATSAMTKDEVHFKLQKTILFWDSISFSSMIAAVVFSYSYAFNHFTINQIGLIPSIILLILLNVVLGAAYAFLFKWRNRYHYIYAIEQFKKYHMDEQWIAIGEDVFDHPEDTVFLELKEQCVLNGFGLVEINFEEEAKLLITPSRNEIFGQERANLAFDRRDSAMKRGRVARFSKIWNEKVRGKIKIPGSDQINRYQLGYVRQAMLTGFSFLLVGGIFHREMQQHEFIFVDEKEYEKEMQEFKKAASAELEEYVLDSLALAPIIEEEPGYLDIVQEEVMDITDTYMPEEIEDSYADNMPILEIEAIPNEDFKVIIAGENGLQLRYECERLYNLKGRYFLVLDNIYSNPQKAQKRVARLNSLDVPVNAFSMDCFTDGDHRYLVYYDLFYSTEKETGAALRRYRKILKKKGFSNKNVRTYSIDIRR